MAETLDRGVVALPTAEGSAAISWRLLQSDPPGTAFNVYRASSSDGPWTRINDAPVTEGCFFTDADRGAGSWWYAVQPGGDGPAPTAAESAPLQDEAYVRIRFQGSYRAQKVGLADLNGDGALDYVIKQPDFNVDPYHMPGYWKKSEQPYQIEAYCHDGTFLWRYDMGWAIEEGIWYSPIVVFDLDGDGKAEVYTKAGEGDPRDPDGRVTQGAEYLVVLDGETGQVRRKIPWPSRQGFESYNYFSRNLLGVAYLDEQRPHLIVERGTYTLIKVHAYDPSLALKWSWKAEGEYASYRGQGMHGLQVADIDGDGRQELVIGAAALDDDGQPLWNTQLRHPDVCYVADIDPDRPGLEVFYGIEPRRLENGVCLVEASSGKVLWGYPGPTTHVHGQGMIGDIDPEHRGIECYAGEKDGSNYWIYSADGKRLSHESLGELSPRAVYWTAVPLKSIVSRGKIFQYRGNSLGSIDGKVIGVADCLGDWREEILTSLEGELRIYSSTIPTTVRRVTLMQDRQYRVGVAHETMGYFYPPQLSEAGWIGW